PEYAQPEDPDAQILYHLPGAAYPDFSRTRQFSREQTPRSIDDGVDENDSEDQWSPSESEVVRNRRQPREETNNEPESEFERSPGPSDSEMGPDSYTGSPQAIPLLPLRNSRPLPPRQRSRSPENNNSSSQSYITGDPTII
ncbi:unnamed protein product, partial [Trichobilharzia regenti]